jgi:hypothetical protein
VLTVSRSGAKLVDVPLPAVTGLVARYDANELGLADLAAVGSWPDLSGNGHTAAQATGSAQPTYRADVLNGRPVVRFDGGDYLSIPTLPAVLSGTDRPLTVLYVARTSASAIANVLAVANTNNVPQLVLRQPSSLLTHSMFLRDDAGLEKGVHAAALTVGAWNQLTLETTGLLGTAYRDGVLSGGPADMNVGPATFDRASLGALERGTVIQFLTGDIAELLIFDRVLTAEERFELERYLRRNWLGVDPAAPPLRVISR